MAVETLEQRVEKLERKLQELECRLAEQAVPAAPQKRGWRSIIGIYADSPEFDEVVRLGQEWRNADRPHEDEVTDSDSCIEQLGCSSPKETAMSLKELIPTVRELPRTDKLRLIHWLATELAQEEGVPLLSPDVEYQVWSPYDAHEAAATLSAFLDEEKAARR